jgi:hypothetical protein
MHKLIDSRSIFSLSLENVFDRLELANNLHQLNLDGLKYFCGQKIWRNLGRLMGTDKWAKLDDTSKLAILQGMAEYHKKRCDAEDGQYIAGGWGYPNVV